MAHEEKSRDAFQPTKRYAAVGMQQGRVLLDDDFNEHERIRLEEARRINLDVIGPAGSPDAGFLPSNGAIVSGGVDFDIAAGTFYLGGLRLWNPATAKFQLQDDWLQQAGPDRPAPTEGRVDLVYLAAWQQPVTAAEDTELFEVALGGPDTSTRLRTMWRVQLASGIGGTDCPGAWASLVAQWAGTGLGTVDEAGERKVDAMLEVGYFQGQIGDLCTPAIAGGYLGAENQTIRVQLTRRGTFTWGFDNAAPVYQADIASDRKTITLASDPRDQAHWPVAGQIVEILPPGARLPNKEKLADETGHLARVTTSFDPVAHTLVVDPPVPVGFGKSWLQRPDHGDLHGAGYFVRVWDRGDDHTSPLEIPIGPGVKLGNTGVQVTITGTALVPGDFWVIAARPKTPKIFVPWDLEDTGGRPVHGTRRFFAPLALIRWHASGSFDVLHDCRPHFLPLTRLRGCCTYTVGDEKTSYGQFTSIQAAVDALPLDGGKVCVLPGVHTGSVSLLGKANVTIEGCGPRSIVQPGEGAPWTILAFGGHDLAIRDLAIDAGTTFAILLVGAGKANKLAAITDVAWYTDGRVTRVHLEGLTIKVAGRSAIAAFAVEDLTIRDNEIAAGPLGDVIRDGSDLGRWPSILSFADDVLIEDNRILSVGEPVNAPGAINPLGQITYTRTALGGIQLGGGSERVEIRENLIDGGNGDGITLGSWAWVPKRYDGPNAAGANLNWIDLAGAWTWVSGISIHINPDGCIEVDWDPPPPRDDGGNPMVPVSMGALEDITIRHNKIVDMGKSGVGVARFFDLSARDEFITVRRLLVEANRIEGCLRLPIPQLPGTMLDVAAQGAITLADVEQLVIRDNDIAGNGKTSIDPICGVFALISSGVVVERNRIVDNAPRVAGNDKPRAGWRGGVVLTRALPPSVTIPLPFELGNVVRQNGEPAARVADNVIVVPEGRAIAILGAGPMSIADNHLTVRGAGLADLGSAFATGGAALLAEMKAAPIMGLLDLLGGVAVTVIDLAFSNELFWLQLVFYENLARQDLEPKPGLDNRAPVAASGQILFEGNQVGLDLLSPPNNLVLSAVNLVTLDDAICADNQIEVDRTLDLVLFTTLVFGLSTRVIGNRVKETMIPATMFLTGASIYSAGMFMNMTTNNQTTRCIAAVGAELTASPNHILLQLLSKDACGRLAASVGGMQRAKMPVMNYSIGP